MTELDYLTSLRDNITTRIAALAPAPPPTPSGTTLRLLQWNSHHGAQGTDGKYDPDRFCDWVAKMTPDICSFNEVETQGTADGFRSRIQQRLKGTWLHGYDGTGNVIVAKTAQAAFERVLIDASIPAYLELMTWAPSVTATLTVASTHLHVSDATKRMAELEAVIAKLPHFVLMDGNFGPDSAEHTRMCTPYMDTWEVASLQLQGTAKSFPGNSGQTKGSARIDYIWVRRDLVEFGAVQIVSAEVVDTRDASGIMPSDHRPLVVTVRV